MKELAAEFGINPRTVSVHRHRAMVRPSSRPRWSAHGRRRRPLRSRLVLPTPGEAFGV